MSCVNDTCGLGGSNLPKPGDPDNNVSLSARTVYGGINLSWSYPSTNPHAVAHTRVYRGPSSDVLAAMQIAIAAGSIFFDSLDVEADTEYYYWIEIVSVNGTVADKVGPASAIARPRPLQTLESLTALIDASKLAQDLKTEINRIPTLDSALLQEVQDRFGADSALSQAVADLVSGVDGVTTYIESEIVNRTTADSALVDSMTLLGARVDDNAAAIMESSTVSAGQYDSLAQQITLVTTKADNNTASIQEETTARTSADEALAEQITTVQTEMNGTIASAQESLNTRIDTVDGKIVDVSAEYFVKLEVNGLIGGFGLYNDGASVDAGFDVDRFWIGRTGPDKTKPFIIDGGIVYIDKARIRDADIDTLKIAGNAITTTVSAYGGGAAWIDPGWNTVQSLTFNSTGAPVLIGFGCFVNPPGYYTTDGENSVSITSMWSLAFYRDGVQLFACDGPSTQPPSNQGLPGNIFSQVLDNPGAGTHTYTLRINVWDSHSSGPCAFSRIITALEVKR